MTFQEYLSARKPTYDINGDVIRLVSSSNVLLDITSVDELQAFLGSRGATLQLLLAAEDLWEGYQRKLSDDKTRARRKHRLLVDTHKEGI